MFFLRPVTALLVVLFAAYLWLAPGYIVIEIPVDRDKTGSGFWLEKHRTELSDTGTSGVLLVYRQVGMASSEQAWKNEAELFAYFEERLTRLGWKFSVAGIHHRIAPESHLLGAENHKLFYRDHSQAVLTLSVWPMRESTTGFYVALTTANPSLGKRLWELYDH